MRPYFKPIFLLVLFSALLLQGCYWYESLSLRINLDSNSGTVEMTNIASLPDKKKKRWTKKDIQQDWEDFLAAYNDGSLLDNRHIAVTGRQLNDNNKALNAVIDFTYKDLQDVDISKSADNSMYLMRKGPNDKIIETNGKTVMIDSVEYIGWNISTKEIYIKYQLLDKDDKRHSLLPHYKKWKKQQEKK
jgi:hypothetical protein